MRSAQESKLVCEGKQEIYKKKAYEIGKVCKTKSEEEGKVQAQEWKSMQEKAGKFERSRWGEKQDRRNEIVRVKRVKLQGREKVYETGKSHTREEEKHSVRKKCERRKA